MYYEGLSASEVMQDLLCTCSKRNLCGTDSCSCRKNRLACVELCSCHGDDVCQNPISTQYTSDIWYQRKEKNLPEKHIVNLIIQVTLHKSDELGPGFSVQGRQN